MTKRVTLGLAVATIMTTATVPMVQAANNNHNPRGNNGVVKINNEVAPDTIPNNHPHVDCTFSVEFYNFDKGDYRANVDFRLHPPTASSDHSLTVKSGNLNPFIGEDEAGGGRDLDASEKYTLGFTGSPHAQQGYHVKVTVTAPGARGSAKKHKVFWVKPCPAVKSATTTSSTSTEKPEQPTMLPKTGASPLQALTLGIGTAVAGTFARLRHFKRNK